MMKQVENYLKEIQEKAEILNQKHGLQYYCIFYDSNGAFKRELMSSECRQNVPLTDSTPDQAMEPDPTFFSPHSSPVKMIVVNTSSQHEVNNYLFNCFEEFQQIPCKILAKQWIKIIEPRKQSRHPYNQGDKAKPYWWPSSARHKEPDHLKKDERISLLISILKKFKERENELINSAERIGDVTISGAEIKRVGPITIRKMKILRDMFRVVKADGSCLEVIKPGKKYSSKVYQRNRMKLEKKYPQNTLLSKLIKAHTPKNGSSSFFPTSSSDPSNFLLPIPGQETQDPFKYPFITPSRTINTSHNILSSPFTLVPHTPPQIHASASFNKQIDPKIFANENTSTLSPLEKFKTPSRSQTSTHDLPLSVLNASVFNTMSNSQSQIKHSFNQAPDSEDTISQMSD